MEKARLCGQSRVPESGMYHRTLLSLIEVDVGRILNQFIMQASQLVSLVSQPGRLLSRRTNLPEADAIPVPTIPQVLPPKISPKSKKIVYTLPDILGLGCGVHESEDVVQDVEVPVVVLELEGLCEAHGLVLPSEQKCASY